MLRNIEKALNGIWRNRANRRPLQSFLLYWAVSALAPLRSVWVSVSGRISSRRPMTGVGLSSVGLGSILVGLLPFSISTIGLTALYVVVPNCQVPFRHALIGGVFAASTFTVARMVFTAVMAESSYALVYGAFAVSAAFSAVDLRYLDHRIGRRCPAHSISAFQTTEQAQIPPLMKALDILYLFWRAQQQGRGIAELEIIRPNEVLKDGIDADSWRLIRDRLVKAQWLKRLDRGHYFLSRDLHEVTLFMLADMMRAEPDYHLNLSIWAGRRRLTTCCDAMMEAHT